MENPPQTTPTVVFRNISIPDILWYHMEPNLPADLETLSYELAMCVENGLKVSLEYKESRSSYVVNLTTQPFEGRTYRISSSFWGGTLLSAMQKAYLVAVVYQAAEVGLVKADEDIKAEAAKLMAKFKEMLG